MTLETQGSKENLILEDKTLQKARKGDPAGVYALGPKERSLFNYSTGGHLTPPPSRHVQLLAPQYCQSTVKMETLCSRFCADICLTTDHIDK